jgi:hypothetical protein
MELSLRLPCLGYSECDKKGGFDRISAKGSFVDSVWGLFFSECVGMNVNKWAWVGEHD